MCFILLILAPVQLDAQSPPNAYMHRPLFCLDELGEVQAALASDDTTLAHQAFNTAEPTCSEEYETLSAHLEDLELSAA